MPSESARLALENLRSGDLFHWTVIVLLAFVLYVYAVEIERRNWNQVFAGLAFWGMDWFNEIWNGLVFHFTQFAPVWGAPGNTSYLILIGLNIEISFMFAVAGIVFSKFLPTDKSLKILGIPNRLFIALAGSIFCVFVEVVILNSIGVLTWDYSWWDADSPWLIVPFGYLHFFLVAFWVHDQDTLRKKMTTVGTILAFDGLCLWIFMGILGWI